MAVSAYTDRPDVRRFFNDGVSPAGPLVRAALTFQRDDGIDVHALRGHVVLDVGSFAATA